uniref:Galectin n=1 Tax=Paramormyrops kingsleyae TaxID=1676925 RepID=A0A3B3RRP3_9TELE
KIIFTPRGEILHGAPGRGRLSVIFLHVVRLSQLPPPPPRFTINIGHGEGDIALNFSVKFDSKRVVMKTLQGGSGSHEKALDSFPFEKGQVFKVRPSVFVSPRYQVPFLRVSQYSSHSKLSNHFSGRTFFSVQSW